MEIFRKNIKKIMVAIAGGLVLIIGIILIPYPGPGWLVVFGGLAILATEFTWARKVHGRALHHYNLWREWLSGQSLLIQIAVVLATCVVVVATLYFLNTFGILNNLFNLQLNWLDSPFGR